MCTSVNTVSELLQKASFICSEKLAIIEAQTISKSSYWSFFSDTFNTLGAFGYNHKGLIVCVGTLIGGITVYSLAQNFGFQLFSSWSFRDLAASSSNLSERILNLDNSTTRNADSIRQLEQTIRNLVYDTNQSIAGLKEHILETLSVCADKEGTSQLIQELGVTLANTNIEAMAQRYAIKMVLQSLLNKGLIDSASVDAVVEFCNSTK